MAFEDWEKRPNGDIAVHPLMGWDTAVLQMSGVLRIHYASGDEDLQRMRAQFLPLVMSGPQARELAEVLLRMADRIDQQPLGTKQ